MEDQILAVQFMGNLGRALQIVQKLPAVGRVNYIVILIAGKTSQLQLVFRQQFFDALNVMLLPGAKLHIVKAGFPDHGKSVIKGQINKELFNTNRLFHNSSAITVPAFGQSAF